MRFFEHLFINFFIPPTGFVKCLTLSSSFMKKFFFIFSALLLLSSCGKSYKVNIEFSKFEAKDKKAYLTDFNSGDTLATATIVDRKCTLEGSFEKPFVGYLTWDEFAYPTYVVIVDEGETSVSIGEKYTVSGPLNEKRAECDQERLMKIYASDENYNDVYMKFYQENKDNILGQWAFASYLDAENLDNDQIDRLLKDAPTEYAQLKIIDKLKSLNKQAELTAPGKDYVDIEMTDSNGKTQKLSDYVGEDHFTIVYFFWPSITQKDTKELLPLNLLHVKSKENNGDFQVIGIPAYSTEEQTKQAIANAEIKFPVLISKEPVTRGELYGLYRNSNYFVAIGGNGKIVWRDYTLDEIVQKMLGK